LIYIHESLHLCHRGIAKAGKKLKVVGSSKDPKDAEPEKQVPEVSGASPQDPEDLVNDPLPQANTTTFDPINIEVDPAITHDPPSPKPPSPAKLTEEVSLDQTAEDVIITSTGYTEPGNPTVLARHSAKEEPPAEDKGKLKLDLESYAGFSASDIHAGYLNRLHTSRDLEAGLVNLMKERYEVCC
jgi:hypothetical protein